MQDNVLRPCYKCVYYRQLQGQDTTIGLMGLSIVIAGMAGSVVCGVILDKSKKFKEVTLGLYLLSTLLMFVYTFVLQARSIPIMFVTTASLGKGIMSNYIERFEGPQQAS